MKSIKPGRGPSMMGGIAALALAVFGILWILLSVNLTQDFMFADSFSSMENIVPLFGVIFVVIALVSAVYNFKNATGKHRYSEFDITDRDEEPDPLNERFGESEQSDGDVKSAYCPYCGAKVAEEYEYCNHCGKKLP